MQAKSKKSSFWGKEKVREILVSVEKNGGNFGNLVTCHKKISHRRFPRKGLSCIKYYFIDGRTLGNVENLGWKKAGIKPTLSNQQI